jgi:hypothetical protein
MSRLQHMNQRLLLTCCLPYETPLFVNLAIYAGKAPKKTFARLQHG